MLLSDKRDKALDILGQLRIHLAHREELICNRRKFLWVVDFPLLVYDEEEKDTILFIILLQLP